MVPERETRLIRERLRELISSSDYTLRGVAAQTQSLSPPERLHHSTLSCVLRGVPGHNLYVQQLLVILKILRIKPLTFWCGSQEAATVVDAYIKLTPQNRAKAAGIIADLLHDQGDAVTLQRRLRRFS